MQPLRILTISPYIVCVLFLSFSFFSFSPFFFLFFSGEEGPGSPVAGCATAIIKSILEFASGGRVRSPFKYEMILTASKRLGRPALCSSDPSVGRKFDGGWSTATNSLNRHSLLPIAIVQERVSLCEYVCVRVYASLMDHTKKV